MTLVKTIIVLAIAVGVALAVALFVRARRLRLGAPTVVLAQAQDDLRARIERALGAAVSSVEQSDRLPAPVAGSQGQYVATLKPDGREVGLFVMAYEWAQAEAPFFWVNLQGDPPGQVVLLPRDGRLIEDTIPIDWIMSDYLRGRRPTRKPSFIALNPRRVLRPVGADDAGYVADSGFLTQHPVTTNLLVRTHWWVERPTARVHALSLMVHRTKDEAEANTLMRALEAALLPRGGAAQQR